MSATPRPWRVWGNEAYPGIEAQDKTIVVWGSKGEDCGVRGDSPKERYDNAELIVRAVNSYDAHQRCVEALRDLTDRLDHDLWTAMGSDEIADSFGELSKADDEARAALAALEEK